MNWTYYLKNAFRKVEDLLDFLDLSMSDFESEIDFNPAFSFLVPKPFADKIKKKDPNDPLLKQVLSMQLENIEQVNFSANPVKDNEATRSKLIHKYQNRVLIITSGNCAVNCRYCFRKLYDYDSVKFTQAKFKSVKEYILTHKNINEIILSGGDPLSLSNNNLEFLITEINDLKQIKFLRIHTRFPVVIPQRIDEGFLKILKDSNKKIIFVLHINHPNEIDSLFKNYMKKLTAEKIQLLNQSVLLKGVNDNKHILYELSQKLIEIGIMPYYLNQLDKVTGSSHFNVEIKDGKKLMREFSEMASGYMVPKYVQDIPGKSAKTIII
jgi:L-lysine 2,3-aminomutase